MDKSIVLIDIHLDASHFWFELFALSPYVSITMSHQTIFLKLSTNQFVCFVVTSCYDTWSFSKNTLGVFGLSPHRQWKRVQVFGIFGPFFAEMDALKEQAMINQFVMVAGCAREQAKQLLQAAHWQFEVIERLFWFRRNVESAWHTVFTDVYFRFNRLKCLTTSFPFSL